MTRSNDERIFEFDGELNEFAEEGFEFHKVNEKGYEKIFQINKGCSIFLHNIYGKKLIFDLHISPYAQNQYPSQCNKSIQIFKSMFGDEVKCTIWEHPTDPGVKHKSYFIDISKKTELEISELMNKILIQYACFTTGHTSIDYSQ